MKSKKKNCIIAIFVILTLLVLTTLFIKGQYVFAKKVQYHDNFGIIDTYLGKTYESIEYYSNYILEAPEETHGDQLINFVQGMAYEGLVFYYAAVTSEGIIETDEIIKGLEWMLAAKVKRVNISLSSKIYSKELDDWIQNHPQIKIYSSYNNLYNSITDYPALYDNVIASGCDRRIDYRVQDHRYKNNNIIVFSGGIKKYKGNSFLSLYSLLTERESISS